MTSPHLFFESTENFLNSAIHTVIPLLQKIPCKSKALRDDLALLREMRARNLSYFTVCFEQKSFSRQRGKEKCVSARELMIMQSDFQALVVVTSLISRWK
jgi:hypothetical protein